MKTLWWLILIGVIGGVLDQPRFVRFGGGSTSTVTAMDGSGEPPKPPKP